MTPKMTAIRDELAEQQGDNHANPIIRSMYPLKSRSEMSREFAQLYSIGFNACHEIMLKKVEEMLISKIKRSLDHADNMHADDFLICTMPIRRIIKQWRDFAGGGK
jgi:hypothetical protein